jgi:hypothetical protein
MRTEETNRTNSWNWISSHMRIPGKCERWQCQAERFGQYCRWRFARGVLRIRNWPRKFYERTSRARNAMRLAILRRADSVTRVPTYVNHARQDASHDWFGGSGCLGAGDQRFGVQRSRPTPRKVWRRKLQNHASFRSRSTEVCFGAHPRRELHRVTIYFSAM